MNGFLNLLKTAARKGIILPLFLSFLISGYSQDNFLFERFNLEDGLSNNSINCILQTSDGFLWVATKDGLNRYDGQGFKVFKNNSSDSLSLPENYVMSLFEGRDSTLWVGTWGGGLCRYDRINERFYPTRKKGFLDDYIQCISEDHSGKIWFGTTTGGLFKIDPSSGDIFHFPLIQNNGGKVLTNNITCILEDDSFRLWIGTWDAGMIKFNPGNGKCRQFLYEPENKNTIDGNGVWNIIENGENQLILSSFSGIKSFSSLEEKITDSPKNSNYSIIATAIIRQALRDKKGRLWIGSYDYQGLFLQERDASGKEILRQFLREDDNSQSISFDRIRWIYEDKKSNIWIGTENGLNKLPAYQPFRQFRHLPLRPNSLDGRVVSSIIEDPDSVLWIGFGGGGFEKINLRTNSKKHFINSPYNKNSLSDNDVSSVYRDKDGIVWICTMNGGLNRFNPVTERFKIYKSVPGDTNSLSSNWIHQVLETSDNLFLVATNSGLDQFDTRNEKFSFFEPALQAGQIPFPKTISVNALFEDSRKNIWVGTWLDGLYRYEPAAKKIFQFLPSEADTSSISSNKITCIYEDSGGNIWLGTHSGGINKFDYSTGRFVRYTTENSLPNDVVFGILEDTHKNLWLSTMKGLVKFNPETGYTRVYDELDGLVNNQFNWRASFKNSSGVMYFGGINGFVSFHPDSVKIDNEPPLVTITSFKVYSGKKSFNQFIPETKKIKLEHKQNFFSIEFTALDMTPNEKHKYAYKLEGIDPDWVYSDSRSTAFYTDIRHGSFLFQVKASNADNVWSEPTSLSITILPAWWNTWWIKVLSLLIIIGIVFIVIRIRFWQLLEIERIRLNIASDLHDEMGSNLSSISVDSQQLMRSGSSDPESFELASDIYKTTNETIDSIRDIIWFINPKNDGRENIVFKMKEKAATQLAGLNWSFDISDDLRLDSFKLEIRRNIFLIYKETLTNVVRHSKAKNCSIQLKKQGNEFIMSISDDGSGFDTANTMKYGGLENIYFRAKKIHAEIQLESEQGKGTSLILRLPLKP
ncbi:MAG: hypothetical protein H6538_05865 [Bacteroidales bacterium]|nr:hypothetical protein [Bacteroidales bacterium]MCB9000090.1 hypothetical protein [Bacteroidales bacterium]